MNKQETGQSTNSDNNMCLTACEKSSCCTNMYYGVSSKEELNKFIPKGTRVTKLETQDDLSIVFDELRYMQKGVYFTIKNDKTFEFVIAGSCPNLGAKGKCEIYEDRPTLCRDLDMGGIVCKQARKRDGLKSVNDII